MSRVINQNTEPLFIFDMPDDEMLSQTISVQGEKGDRGDPTKTSQLINDSDFTTNAALNAGLETKADVATVQSLSSQVSDNTNAISVLQSTNIKLARVNAGSDGRWYKITTLPASSDMSKSATARIRGRVSPMWSSDVSLIDLIFASRNQELEVVGSSYCKKVINEIDIVVYQDYNDKYAIYLYIKNWFSIDLDVSFIECDNEFNKNEYMTTEPSGSLVWSFGADATLQKNINGTISANISGNAATVNNHTVETDVPANALFTDTIYDDTELRSDLESDISDVSSGVSALSATVDSLSSSVAALTSADPIVVGSISEMTDTTKVYILTTDGNWYYYHNNAWTVGGAYNSDVTYADMKALVNTISQSGSNPLNIYNCKIGELKTADGSESTPSGNYWITDYIPISPKYQPSDDRWAVANVFYELNDSVHVYKFCYYDSDKNFVRTVTSEYVSTDHNISMNAQSYPDVSSYKYIRLQFKVSDVPLADADRIFYTPNKTYFDKNSYTPSNAIKTYNIASGEVLGANLSDRADRAIKCAGFSNGIITFDKRDFSVANVVSSDGTSRQVLNRLSNTKTFKVPRNTTISVDADSEWYILALQHDAAGAYLGRYTSDWAKEIYFSADVYIKLTAKYGSDGTQEINTDAYVESLLSALSCEKSEGAYTYDGAKIELGNTYTALNTGLPTLHQDGAIYGDAIIEVGSTGYYTVQNIDGLVLKEQTALDQRESIAPHANSVCFGTERYDVGDNFPIFYNNAYNNTALPKGACYAYRLKNDYTTTLLQSIQIGFTADNIWSDGNDIRPYGNFIVDTDNNKLYAFTMKDDIQKTRFFKFALPTLSQGSSVILGVSDIEDYFDVDYMYLLQGACYFNGKIYATSGNDSVRAGSSKLNVVNLSNKTIETVVSLSQFFAEPETIFVRKNKLYIGQTKLFEFGFN